MFSGSTGCPNIYCNFTGCIKIYFKCTGCPNIYFNRTGCPNCFLFVTLEIVKNPIQVIQLCILTVQGMITVIVAIQGVQNVSVTLWPPG